MNSDRNKKIESKLKLIDLEISKIKKRANLKIKNLQDSKSTIFGSLKTVKLSKQPDKWVFSRFSGISDNSKDALQVG